MPLSESLVFQEGYGGRCQDLLEGESKDRGSDKTLLNYRHNGLLFYSFYSCMYFHVQAHMFH